MPTVVGIISDTHGILRPEAVAALGGSDLIVHAGDVGRPEVLSELKAMAPIFAVRGNVDAGPWAQALPETEIVPVEQAYLYVLHELKQLDLDPVAGGFRAVISGHSHRPFIQERGGVLFINPGSAGPRRFSLPITVARLRVDGLSLEAELISLFKEIGD